MRTIDARLGVRLGGQAGGLACGSGDAAGHRQRLLRRGDLLRQSVPTLGNPLGGELNELGRLGGARAPKRLRKTFSSRRQRQA